jgi:Rrf2 family nitric oxide-sensitive transcriptional repressor
MLTQTSESAIRLLIHLALKGGSEPQSYRQIAEKLGESVTYMGKVTSLLVRANVLRAHRGALGGVQLSRPPQMITMLSIVEACQGILVGDYCQATTELTSTCGFHHASAQLHKAISEVLSRWTLADLASRPEPTGKLASNVFCRMKSRWTPAAQSAVGPGKHATRRKRGANSSRKTRR